MKPNHICKYSLCKKHYYACSYCSAVESWRSLACCREHYILYQREVLAERAKCHEPDTLPERLDMTREQVLALKRKPLPEVLEQTRKELARYADDIDEIGILATVEKINAELAEAPAMGGMTERGNEHERITGKP